MDTKEKLKRYISLLTESSTIFNEIGGLLLKSQVDAVNGMYDLLVNEARELHKDHIPFLRKELKSINRKRKNDLRILHEAYSRNKDFNIMILDKFGSVNNPIPS